METAETERSGTAAAVAAVAADKQRWAYCRIPHISFSLPLSLAP